MLFVFVLATFIGLGVIRRVSRLLYTPLMSLDERDFGHRGRRLDHRHWLGLSAHIRLLGAVAHCRLDDQHRQRLFDYRSHAEDVQDEPASRRQLEMIHSVVQLAYVVATALFVLSLHWMNDPKTARRGVSVGIVAMVLAVLATWIRSGGANGSLAHHLWIILAIVAGFVVGVPLSRVPLTAVPQRTALSHAFGGLATGLVGTAEYFLWLGEGPRFTHFRTAALVAEVILGFVTFTGSLMAAGKLQELKWIPQRPVTYPLQNFGNIGVLRAGVALGVALVLFPAEPGRARVPG